MNKIEIKTEEPRLTEILNGKFKNFYLIYNRKSTDDEDNQKNSISYQKTENMRYALKEKLPIAEITIKGFCAEGVVSEKHSGFKEDNEIIITNEGLVQYRIDRPKFQKMLQFVSQGYFKGLVCLCWDRISRNKGDDTLIRKLMRRGVDIRFTYANYDKTSSGALHMDIDGMFSQHHSRVTSEKVTLTIRNARAKGICTYKAPIGYLNIGEMDNKPFDPKRAPIIKQLFEYYSTGEWSLSDLERYAKDQGLLTVPMRPRRSKEQMLEEDSDDEVKTEKISKPITINHISRILTNKFYIGKIIGSEGQYVESSSHLPLVGEELFYKVQSMLKKKKVSIHFTEKREIPLRGMIRCHYCKRVYTPYIKKGIKYYNSRCVARCQNSLKNFNFSFVEMKIINLISNLYFTENELAHMDAQIETKIALLEEKRNKNIDLLENQKNKIRDDLAYLRTNKLTLLKTKVYSPEALFQEEEKLSSELTVLQTKEVISDTAMRETMNDIKKLSELVKNLIPYYNFADPFEKEKIIRIIFSELYFAKNVFQFKCKNGFECFENRMNAVCDPTENRTLIDGLKTRCPNR